MTDVQLLDSWLFLFCFAISGSMKNVRTENKCCMLWKTTDWSKET